MISVPVHTVPKMSGKLQLVVDHSAGDFSPDSHIARDDVHNDLDTVQHLGNNLLHFRSFSPHTPLWLSSQTFCKPTGVFQCTQLGKRDK